jgi:ADP-ribose pyrophosphatase YjhB (NUDIX family)
MQISKYPNAFYRVSVKALARDGTGRVLLCKEASPHWSLPGGGVDHGEESLVALKRELREELGADDIVNTKLSSVIPFYVAEHERWQMWIVYEITLGSLELHPGQNVHDAAFVDITPFKTSRIRSEQLVYKAVLAAKLA